MKTIYLMLIVLVLSYNGVRAQNNTTDPNNNHGQANLTTVTNDDPNSCLVTLSVEYHPDKVTFFATIIQNPIPDCTHHDLQYTSFFRGDNLNDSIVLAPTANASVSSGSITLSDIIAHNGTACISLGYDPNATMRYHSCFFRYNDIKFAVSMVVNSSSNQFNTARYNVFDPMIGTSKMVDANGRTIWKRSPWSYPDFLGMISNKCGEWSNTINSLDAEFVVTGMDLKQYMVDLSKYWTNYTADPMWVRQKGTDKSKYISINPNPAWFPFASNPVNFCSDTGKKYKDFLPNMQYCANGCDVTFALAGETGDVYFLQTNGFVTTA